METKMVSDDQHPVRRHFPIFGIILSSRHTKERKADFSEHHVHNVS